MARRQFYCGNGISSTWTMDKCVAPHKPSPSVWADWFLRVLPAANRVRDVQLLHEDGLKAIERAYKNGPDTLIYVDPPYVGHEKEYRYQIDYPAMVELLKAASAKIVVSESPAAGDFFSSWNRIERNTPRRVACERRGGCSDKTEVLYTNF